MRISTHCSAIATLALLLVGGVSPWTGMAQDRGDDRRDGDRGDRGDRDRGGRGDGFRGPPGGFPFGGGFGPPGGGFGPGGGFPGGGFPGGGFGPGGGGFNPADMLRRFDENGNGVLEPDESGGRARFFLERIVREVPGMDLNRPIPIDRLTQAMERLRSQRESGQSDSSSSSSRSSSSSSPGAAPAEPLVPGFDLVEVLPLPLAFGVKAEVASVKVGPEDQREAEERLRRYDSNRDGLLDREEIGRNRWSDDPFTYDMNRDGKLSVSELAVRYARRRASESASRGSSGGSSRGSSSGGSSGDSSGGDPRMEMMMRFTFDRADTNRSGVLERDEWSNSRSDPSDADSNRDSRITREEYLAWMQSRMSSGGGGPSFGGFRGRGDGERGDRGEDRGEDEGRSFFSRRSDSSSSSSGSSSTPQDLAAYRAKSAAERLPKGLPDWFARNDANADGQVAMAEFSASWSESVGRDFAQFDLNGDGFVTPKECLKATDQGAVRGSSSSSSSGSNSSIASATTSGSRSSASAGISSRDPSPPREPSTSSPPAAAAAPPVTNSAASASAPAVKLDSRTLAYFQQVVKKYDTNGDGVLTKDEWTSMPKDPTPADRDNDSRITIEEYATWSVSK